MKPNYTVQGKDFLIIASQENPYENLYKGCDKILLLVKLSKSGKPAQTVYSSACNPEKTIKYIKKII
jgi:hypothetical protein